MAKNCPQLVIGADRHARGDAGPEFAAVAIGAVARRTAHGEHFAARLLREDALADEQDTKDEG